MKPLRAIKADRVELWHSRCQDVLPRIKTNSIDMVLCDPPYGIAKGAAFIRRGGSDVETPDHEWNDLVPFDEWLPDCARVVRPGCSVAFFADFNRIEESLAAVRSAGLEVFSRFWIVKAAPPCTPRPVFQSGIEECVIAVKPGATREWHGGGATLNYWRGMTPSRLRSGYGHPCEKPVAAMAQLIGALCRPGGTVLDPFSGTGATLEAATLNGYAAVGVEVSADLCELTRKRLRQTPALFPLEDSRGD